MSSRSKRRWAGRLRTAGALLLLLGIVGVLDALLAPAGERDLGLAAAGALLLMLSAGAWAFFTGQRWSGKSSARLW